MCSIYFLSMCCRPVSTTLSWNSALLCLKLKCLILSWGIAGWGNSGGLALLYLGHQANIQKGGSVGWQTPLESSTKSAPWYIASLPTLPASYHHQSPPIPRISLLGSSPNLQLLPSHPSAYHHLSPPIPHLSFPASSYLNHFLPHHIPAITASLFPISAFPFSAPLRPSFSSLHITLRPSSSHLSHSLPFPFRLF